MPMIVSKLQTEERQLDTELCRAMFEKDPDKMIALLSDWLELNGLTISADFQIPAYLEQVLVAASQNSETASAFRVFAS